MSSENWSCFARLRPYRHRAYYTLPGNTSRRGRVFTVHYRSKSHLLDTLALHSPLPPVFFA